MGRDAGGGEGVDVVGYEEGFGWVGVGGVEEGGGWFFIVVFIILTIVVTTAGSSSSIIGWSRRSFGEIAALGVVEDERFPRVVRILHFVRQGSEEASGYSRRGYEFGIVQFV